MELRRAEEIKKNELKRAEEIRKDLEIFLKNKYESREIENFYSNLSYIDKGAYGWVYYSIDQNGIK